MAPGLVLHPFAHKPEAHACTPAQPSERKTALVLARPSARKRRDLTFIGHLLA